MRKTKQRKTTLEAKSYLSPSIFVVNLEMKLGILLTATVGTSDMENEDF